MYANKGFQQTKTFAKKCENCSLYFAKFREKKKFRETIAETVNCSKNVWKSLLLELSNRNFILS